MKTREESSQGVKRTIGRKNGTREAWEAKQAERKAREERLANDDYEDEPPVSRIQTRTIPDCITDKDLPAVKDYMHPSKGGDPTVLEKINSKHLLELLRANILTETHYGQLTN